LAQIRLLAVRSYGSAVPGGGASTGESARGPILLESTPRPGERVRIDLGKTPDWLERAQKVTFLLGDVRATTAPGEEIHQIAAQDAAPRPQGSGWRTTITIERDVEVDESMILPRRLRWLDAALRVHLDREYLAYCQPVFDEIVVHMSASLGPAYLKNLLSEQLFFSAPGRETYGMPRQPARPMAVSTSNGGMVANLSGVAERLRSTLRRPSASRLRLAQRWYAEAVVETDPMKRFLWCFMGIEVLTHELAPRYYARVVESLGTPHSPAGSPAVQRAHTALMLRQDRGTLQYKFAVVALGLFPTDVDYDIQIFEKINQARDDLAHGSIQDVAQLPSGDALVLLNKYLAAAVASARPQEQRDPNIAAG